MAKGKKTGGRDFTLGNTHSRCKRSRRQLQAMAEKIHNLDREGQVQIKSTIAKILLTSPAQYEKTIKDFRRKATTMLEVSLLKVISQGMKTGDEKKIAFLVERWIGKPRTEVYFNGNDAFVNKEAQALTFDDINAEIVKSETMPDEAKFRAITDVLYRKQQLELHKKSVYTVDEFQSSMEATMTAAQQTLANNPKALDKFTQLYIDAMKVKFGDRMLETDPHSEKQTDSETRH